MLNLSFFDKFHLGQNLESANLSFGWADSVLSGLFLYNSALEELYTFVI